MRDDGIIKLDDWRRRAEQARFDELVDDAEADDEFVDEFTEGVIFNVVEAAWQNGFDLTNNPTSIRDVLLLGEALRGLLRRTKGVYHPTHDVAEALFVFERDEEELAKFLAYMKENYEDVDDGDDDDY